MGSELKITSVKPIHADAAWAAYTFVKVETDGGITGYAEVSDWRMPQAVAGGVKDLATILTGQDALNIEARCQDMYRLTCQGPGGVIQRAIGGVECALWDIKGKALNQPVYELLGGKLRSEIRVYWSHCGTYRARYPKLYGKPLESYADITALGREVRERGYTALKTNVVVPGNPSRTLGTADGQNSHYVVEKAVELIGAFKDGTGADFDTALDLNFHFQTLDVVRIARALEQFKMLWLEVDSFEPEVIRQITDSTSLTICSAESVNTLREYQRFLDLRAMDVAMFDLPWTGLGQSLQIARQAALREIEVAPHNYYSHLSTFQNAHLCAVLPNLKIMETDVDSCPWRDEYVTELPEIRDGYLQVPTGPGWGVELNEEAIASRPWKGNIPFQ